MTAPVVRVTQIVFDLDGGGLETLVADTVRHFAGTQVVSSIITLGGRVGRVGATVRDLADQYHVLRPKPGISMIAPLGLIRAIQATRADVVHLHSGAWYKSALAARIAGVRRVVYTEHGREHYDPPLMRRLDRLASTWTDVVVPVSDRLGRYLAKTVGVSPRRLHTIPNGVDAERFTPGPRPERLLAELRIPADGLLLGSVGRLERVKRFDRLVGMLSRLPREIEGRPVYLLLCGEGSARADIEAEAAALGVADRVRLPGWVSPATEVHRLLDVFALSSESEGASVSLLEAMATGTAPAVMDVGANVEILGAELATQAVAAGDDAGLERVVVRALGDAVLRRRIGGLARERVLDRYTLDRMMAAYEAVYRGPSPD